MFKQKISFETWGGEKGKYRLIDSDGNHIDKSPEDNCERIAKSLASNETHPDKWEKEFTKILGTKFAGGGRIMANIGAHAYKKEVSPINCVVSRSNSRFDVWHYESSIRSCSNIKIWMWYWL